MKPFELTEVTPDIFLTRSVRPRMNSAKAMVEQFVERGYKIARVETGETTDNLYQCLYMYTRNHPELQVHPRKHDGCVYLVKDIHLTSGTEIHIHVNEDEN